MNTNENKIGPRERRALEILRDGGRLCTALRTGWGGRVQQAYWLQGPDGSKVRGYGHATFHALVGAGFVVRDPEVLYGSSCRREYVVR